jgi:hypothetical protein
VLAFCSNESLGALQQQKHPGLLQEAAVGSLGGWVSCCCCGSYWGKLSGKVPCDDGTRQPLLDSEVHVRTELQGSPG